MSMPLCACSMAPYPVLVYRRHSATHRPGICTTAFWVVSSEPVWTQINLETTPCLRRLFFKATAYWVRLRARVDGPLVYTAQQGHIHTLKAATWASDVAQGSRGLTHKTPTWQQTSASPQLQPYVGRPAANVQRETQKDLQKDWRTIAHDHLKRLKEILAS